VRLGYRVVRTERAAPHAAMLPALLAVRHTRGSAGGWPPTIGRPRGADLCVC
jgi:hypothetical protein